MYLSSNIFHHFRVGFNGKKIISKPKLMKSYLRSTTDVNRQNHLILMFIERKLTNTEIVMM